MAIGVYAMLMVVAPRPTAAQQQTWTGNTSNDWLVGSNWSGGRVPTTGRAGDVFINTTSPNATVIGASGAVTATSGVVHMGNFSGTSSELTIQNGSTLTSSDNGRIGQVAGANSKVTVTGAGSTWTINSTRFSPTIAFVVGNAGTGTLNISNGGSVVTTNGGYFYIAQGATSSGTLNVTSGGVLITDGEGYVGDLGIGTATISGTNSLWNVGQQLTVGSSGAGTLTVADEGRVEVGGNLVIANNAGSTGTLNIGAAPGDPAKAPGIVETSAIQFGAGTGAINFNHTSTRYVFTPIMSGDGAVNQIAGTTILPGEHSYTGPTTISGGTLAVNGSITSDVTVQSGGTLAGIGMISAGVVNRGTVAPGNSIGTLTITGNYVGSGGRLEIESVLAGNASPTDQLVLDGGSARGRTGVQVINLNGPGGVTSGNGIPVVVAQNGATTGASAFSLTGPVAAGPYQYVLRRGSGSPAEAQSWYLASHVQGSDNGGGHGGPLIPLYRPETSAYAVLPAMARAQSLATMGTFHERQGNQGLLRGASNDRTWGRFFAQRTEQHHSGKLRSHFEGDTGGLQAGIDAIRTVDAAGNETVAGIFFAFARTDGDAYGHALGVPDNFVGSPKLDGASMGAYWTRMTQQGSYLDAVAMVSHYGSEGYSTNGVAIDTNGTGVVLSLEGGYPMALGPVLTFEPQAQIIYQHLNFGDANDIFSTVDIDTPDAGVGRIGARLAGDFGAWQPYLKANLWQDWVEADTATYAGLHAIDSEHSSTALEFGGGLVADLGPRWGLWIDASYTEDVDGERHEIVHGTAGLRMLW